MPSSEQIERLTLRVWALGSQRNTSNSNRGAAVSGDSMSDEEYGDEDFENYDEDFEEDNDYDVLPKSMLAASAVKDEPSPASPAVRPSSRGGLGLGGGGGGGGAAPYVPPRVVDIPSAPPLTDAQRKVARKRLAASLKKFPKLELQEVVVDELLILQSLSEYDLYNMGRSIYAGKKVATAQTNDDAKEEECQTDEIETQAYASQAPEDRNQMTDSEVQASSVAAPAPGSKAQAPPPEVVRATAAMTRITQMEPGMELKLNAFMQWAGPIVLAALGIAPNSKKITMQSDPTGGKGVSSGIVPLAHEGLLAHRPVNSLAFVPAGGEPLVLAAYGPVGAQLGAAELLKDHTIATKGCMCVWDLSAPSVPKAVLISEGTPSCCGFAPSPATNIVFAGMEEGGVCLWDLEEPEGRHAQEVVAGTRLTTRRPAFTTECSADLASGSEPIVSIAAVSKGSRATPCYLYTLSAWGSVTVWTVHCMSAAEAASLDSELGMRQGSRVRLLRVTANVRMGHAALRPMRAPDESSIMAGVVQSSSLQALPHNQRHFLVAADGGRVLKGSWAGLAPAPKEYVAHDHTAVATLQGSGRIKLPSCVTSLHVSPVVPWAFLAGHDDGTVTLHGLSLATAALVWPGAGNAVKAVRWSPTRPCVFFVLDAMCTLSCFDLAQNKSGPVYTQSFMAADPKQPGVASLATALEVGQLPQATNGDEHLSGFAVGYDDGHVDFLAFSATYTKPGSNETQMLVDLVGPEVVPAKN